MTESSPSFLQRCAGATPRDRRNLWRVTGTFAVWGLAFSTVSQLVKRGVLTGGPLAWLAAALPVALGIVVLVTYARFLRETDELQRLIMLEALALAFGGTFFAICGYQVFERLGAPEAEMVHAVVVMGLLYALGSVLGAWRYR